MKRTAKPSERGAALFAVLAMVMLLAGFAAVGLSRLRAATDRISDSSARSEAQLLANSGTTAALALVYRLKALARTGAASMEEPITLEYGNGEVEVRFSEGGNCFNLNSLSRPPATVSTGQGKAAASPQDFARLLTATGIPLLEADTIARATAGRLAETGVLWADGSEWTMIPGVTARHWQLAGRYLCALPNRDGTSININRLTAEQAPLLAGIGMGADDARRAIASRPATGWGSADDFMKAGSSSTEGGGAGESLVTTSRWLTLEVEARTPRATVRRELLIDSIRQPARVVSSRWRAVEVST